MHNTTVLLCKNSERRTVWAKPAWIYIPLTSIGRCWALYAFIQGLASADPAPYGFRRPNFGVGKREFGIGGGTNAN